MVNQKFDLVNHSTTNTIKLVARRIKKFVELNDKIPNGNSTLTHFHSKHVAPISIESYLNRILKYTLCGNECFLSVLIYFHRMSQIQDYIPSFPSSCKKNKKPFIINSYNIHRLLIAGVTVSAKFNSDIFFLNSHYAKVGGLPINELNSLEMEFLMLNNYDLHVSVEELQYTGNCLLNNILPEQVVVNGVKRMELLSQPVFFNKTINKFALTFEDTILIEKRIRDEERKYGRAARLIKNSLYERSKSGDRELERNKSNNYRSLKYSKSYDIMKASSKKDKFEEPYRHSYQPPNALPYLTGKSDSKRSDFSHHSSKKSSNSKLNYRHSIQSMNHSQYQEKVDLQKQLKNASHHGSMIYMANNLPYCTESSKKVSTDKYDVIKLARKRSQEIDENLIKANFKAFIDPENKLNDLESEKYQKTYNIYKEMYIKEVINKNKSDSSQLQVVPIDDMNSDTMVANASVTNDSLIPKDNNLKKLNKDYSHSKTTNNANYINSKENESFNTNSSSSFSFLDSEIDQSYYRTNDHSYQTLSPHHHLHQGLNPSQPNNHRISHLDLNQARKNYSCQQQNLSTIPLENNRIIRNNHTGDSIELSSPKPNNSYKNAKRINRSSQSKNIKNGEYQLKVYEEYQPEDCVLTNEDESFNTTIDKSYSSNVLSESSKNYEFVDQQRPVKKHSKEKVHKRLSRNFNRILNNFNGDHSNKNDYDKEAVETKDTSEKAKENLINTNNNTIRVRKGVKLMERKIKGLSLSHLLKQNKNDAHDSGSGIKERHSFSVSSLSHAERQKLNFLTDPEYDFNNNEAINNSDENLRVKNSNSKIKAHDKVKGKKKEKSCKKSSSSLKKLLKEEISLESSRRYYETLTSILKRNKENSKKDYSTYLNDVDIKIISNSNDTINQITEIYHSYTENQNSNLKSNSRSNSNLNVRSTEKESGSLLSPNNEMNISDTTFGCITNRDHSEPSFIKENNQTINIEKEKVSEIIKQDEPSVDEVPSYTNVGEFDDIQEHTSSIYHDLNDEKKSFNQNIYDFNKYYHNHDTEENSEIKEDNGNIENSTDIMNSFDLKIIDEKAKTDNNKENFGFINKAHSYTSTDIYSYYANLNNSNKDEIPTLNHTKEKENSNEYDSREKENNQDVCYNGEYKENKDFDNTKIEVEEKLNNFSNLLKQDAKNINILKNYYKATNDQSDNESSLILPSKSELVRQKKNYKLCGDSNTDEYKNEIHNIKNFLEQQNETINADFSKVSNEEGEMTNISSFITSIPSTDISSSAKDGKSAISSPSKHSELEVEKIAFTDRKDLQKKEGKNFSDYYNTRRLNDSYLTEKEEYPIETFESKKDISQNCTEEITEVLMDTESNVYLRDQTNENNYHTSLDKEGKNIIIQNKKNDTLYKNESKINKKNCLNKFTASAGSPTYSSNKSDYDCQGYIDDDNKYFCDKELVFDNENNAKNVHHQILNNKIKNSCNYSSSSSSSSSSSLSYRNHDPSTNDIFNKNSSPTLSKSSHNKNSNLNGDNDKARNTQYDSYASFAKKGGSVDLNNPLSYISYPNYPIHHLNGNINSSHHHRESFQNLLKQFQRNCNTDNDNITLSDLQKEYGPRHIIYNSDISNKNGGSSNVTFNEILEKFKKKCDGNEEQHHSNNNNKQINSKNYSSSTNLDTMKPIPYSSDITTDIINSTNEETTSATVLN
ncbi:hypothetical protein BCR36DRAFT_62474 [Piromyces finnis]|uniref:Cyclin-domain-containing protein n=1 Tax=Piromyces finnis TaxID=1754191 RepID=A0A1Y1VAN9_9FUNG|nr:hypothetical protein BCR36DRAFT_62474 [Piromyces finnis]|eukprot:ORX49980.1 hypothetical protein BCR36DRAFT_62474 [Piromyces finnis]